jgi:hypothetical protein
MRQVLTSRHVDFNHYTTPPSLLIKASTGILFAGLGSASDWIFGGCLVYDLVALAVGQSQYNSTKSWGTMLGAYAVGTAAIVGVRNWVR